MFTVGKLWFTSWLQSHWHLMQTCSIWWITQLKRLCFSFVQTWRGVRILDCCAMERVCKASFSQDEHHRGRWLIKSTVKKNHWDAVYNPATWLWAGCKWQEQSRWCVCECISPTHRNQDLTGATFLCVCLVYRAMWFLHVCVPGCLSSITFLSNKWSSY